MNSFRWNDGQEPEYQDEVENQEERKSVLSEKIFFPISKQKGYSIWTAENPQSIQEGGMRKDDLFYTQLIQEISKSKVLAPPN